MPGENDKKDRSESTLNKIIAKPVNGTMTAPQEETTLTQRSALAEPEPEKKRAVESLPSRLDSHSLMMEETTNLIAAMELRLLGVLEDGPPHKLTPAMGLGLRVETLTMHAADNVSRLQRLLTSL